jgi:hypothetical protein
VTLDPNYELIARIWRDSSSNSEDSVYVEIIGDVLQITVMTDEVATAVTLPPARVRDLRNALTRAEKRLS